MNKSILFTLIFGFACSLRADFPSRIKPAESVSAESVKLDSIPNSLRPLFSDSSYQGRCRLVKGLKSDLYPAEIDALLFFISADPEQVGLSRDYFNSVGDKVINKLEEQENVPPALIDMLISMFSDDSGNFTWRDYCVQHLGSLYAGDAASGKRAAMLKTLNAALKPETHMAGTAILALQNNIGKEGVPRRMVVNKAKRVALDENQDEASRLTSMLVAAELGNQQMLPLARGIIDSREPVQFRMAAMAVLGMQGAASDLSTLAPYTSSPDMRLRTASRAAIKKINGRQTTAQN